MRAQTGRAWALEEFGTTGLRDRRRVVRLVDIATGVAGGRSGKVSGVFSKAREREGTYDFLESEHVRLADVAEAVFSATAERARGDSHVFVAIDGTSLSFTDETGEKGLGRIGTDKAGARGIKVMTAYAVSSARVPLGLVDQIMWARSDVKEPKLTADQKLVRNKKMKLEDKESGRFVDAAKGAVSRLAAVGVRPWLVIDREADNREILSALSELPCHFTVRANWNRVVADTDKPKEYLREALGARPSVGTYELELGRTTRRKKRTATMTVRTAQLELQLRNPTSKSVRSFPINVVWVRETDASASAANDTPIEWLLYTNVSVLTSEDAQAIVRSYAARWAVEEFHRTWKSGNCNVEESQLRSFNALSIWATVLAANAARIERLKHLSRKTPAAPATTELSALEVEVLVAYRKQDKRPPARGTPSILQVTEWIAELGGWISSNGPPGSVVLGRGLERFNLYVAGFSLAQSMRRERRDQ
jgi:hypothetical protein